MRPPLILALFVLVASISASSQVAPSAYKVGSAFTVGAGASVSSADWDKIRLLGGSAWANWTPAFLKGPGLEVEARDTQYIGDGTGKFRQLSLEAGPIYVWRQSHRLRPYAKVLVGYGKINFDIGNPIYTHDSSMVLEPAGGVELKLLKRIGLNVEYSDQFWPQLYNYYPPVYQARGVTAGASYHF
jgi:hypothetical protein